MNKDNQNNPFSTLIDTLEQEIELYSDMAGAIQEKQDAIISGQIEKLRNFVSKEKKVINKSMEKARERKEIQARISSQCQINNPQPNLKTIIDIARPKYAIKLSNLRYRLKDILNDITRTNNENKLLLDFSIEHVKGMAQLFLNINDEDHEVYGVDGILRMKQDDNKMLDFQI
ncbi:MAG: flagellar protein FlgN [Candidatus Marinimicrobia bacterium]|nr:flagellar protein FlgN [Candidatus Neomarinimicrobiota bacterium]